MMEEIDFDALAKKAMESNGGVAEMNSLYGHVFALPSWHFIARGTPPNVNPYVASNASYAGGQQMVRAFTDTRRLLRFAQANALTDARGGAAVLTIPTVEVVSYLEQFIADGVEGIWFNSDAQSEGFFGPLKQLRWMKERLDKSGWRVGSA